jgi:subtilase family serine protease
MPLGAWMSFSCLRRILLYSGLSLLAITSYAGVSGRQPAHSAIQGNTPAVRQEATLLGHKNSGDVLEIVVGLRMQHEDELDALIERQQDPSSPDYHRWITPADFVARFAPEEADVSRVSSYLQSQGLTVLQVTPNRTLIQARGTVSQVEQAFQVRVNDYNINGAIQFSNDTDPQIPAALAPLIRSVSGLSSLGMAHSLAGARAIADSTSQIVYTPFQIATAYNFPNTNNADHGATTYDGTGVTIAVMAPYTYDAEGVSFFFQYYGLTRTGSLTIEPVNGGSTSVTFEDTLDVEQIGAQAMGADIVVYDTPNSSFANMQLLYSQIVSDNTAQIVSQSWVACEADMGSANISSAEATLKQGVAQGMAFFIGSGDLGAYACPGESTTLAVDFPSSSQYFTSVGGTNVYLSSKNHITSETVWDDADGASGGGQSSSISHPSWQKGAGVPKNNTRDIADVAFDASDLTGFYVYYQDGWYYGYGTSFGGPNWAALWALGVESIGGKRTGNVAPDMYTIGGSSEYHKIFFDVTKGTNGYYSAAKNWDYPTGWGSPNGTNLVEWLISHP